MKMREALNVILPKVLESPEWLPQALNDFNDSEIIEVFNAVIYGEAPNETDEIPF